MVYLFALLFMVSLIAAFIGLVKPSAFQFGKPTIPSRWKVFGISLLVSFISLAMVGVFAPEVEDKTKVAQQEPISSLEKQTAVLEPEIQENDLGFTPEKFRKDLNAQLQKVNVSYLSPVMEFKRENGEVNNTINYMFTEAVGLVGTVNKTNNNIKEITLIYGGDSEKDVADYLIVAGSIANAISPNSTELPKRILDLMNQALEKKNENHSFSSQGITYTANASETLGFVLIMSK